MPRHPLPASVLCRKFTMKRFVVVLLFIPLLALDGCGRSTVKVKGKNPTGKEKTVLAIRAGDAGTNVVLTGTLTEKCPTAGCWFWLNDSTGMIRVDTKIAGFVVTDVPLNCRVTVAGRVVELEGEPIIHASGIRY